MRIIHLSDIHYNNTENERKIWRKLIKDLKNLNLNKNEDLIFITGDLINKGGENIGRLDTGFSLFLTNMVEPLLNELGLLRENIFFCPGNHDVDRKADDEYIEAGLKGKLTSQDSINSFMETRMEEFKSGIFKIKDYKDFERGFYENIDNTYISNFNSNFILNKNGERIGITCINSSWRCSIDDDKNVDDNHLIIGEFQINSSLEILKECNIKICLMHHSFNDLQEFEKTHIKKLITQNYNYLFTGHVHSSNSELNINMIGNLFTSTAQSNSIANKEEKDIEYAMGYSIVELDNVRNKIICRGRKYSYNREEYVNNVDYYGDKGYLEYPMLGDEEKEEFNRIKAHISRIKDVHLEDFNEHLLSYKTDTKAPKTINEVFVLPTIISNDEDSDDEIQYSLDDICKYESNILLLGLKESGKTILLDKITIELVKNFDIYKKIPVKIDLKNMISSSIDGEIRKFLGIKKGELENLIKKNKIVLIVDNIDFSMQGEKPLKRLKIFMNNNQEIKIIASCDCQIEGRLPLDIANNNLFEKFDNLYIKSWKTKEIEGIINTWFYSSEDECIDVTVADVIKIFKNIKISITPLNISMFLWIIEHQQNYRMINSGKLVECFFEHLLEKLNIDDSYSDTFDYTNKIRLLAALAYEMYNNEEQMYKLEYNKLVTFVCEYITKRKFDVKGDILVNYFINKGILVEQLLNNKRFIAFRFECFYRFFIMQYMFIDTNFKEYVLREDKYLFFQSEIDYYTGIRRDDDILLSILSERMNREFDKVEKILLSNNCKIDSYFETSKSTVENLELEKINLIKEKNNSVSNKQLNSDKRINSIEQEVSVGEVKDSTMMNPLNRLFNIWTLTAKVLKNTEETSNGEIKNIIYKDVVRCSVLTFIIYKNMIDKRIDKLINENPEAKALSIFKEMEITSKIIPLINSDNIRAILATNKLVVVINEEVDNNRKSKNISEIEEFISLFLLFDINKEQAISNIEKFINKFNSNYMKDVLFLKLMSVYIINNNSALEKRYLNMLGEVKTKNYTLAEKSSKKSRVISGIKNKKIIEESSFIKN